MSLFSRLGAVMLLTAAALPAISITSVSFQVNGGALFGGGPLFDVVPGGPGQGDYVFNGELNVYEGGGLGPAGPAVTFGAPLTGPISFRFTNAGVLCATGDPENVFSCGKAQINFVAFINFDGPVTDLGGLFGVEGSGGGNATFGVGIEGNDIASINNIFMGSSFSESAAFAPGLVSSNGPNSLILAMGLLFTSTPVGGNLTLPDSLFQQIGVQDAGGVPEPGTMAIVGTGLVGALWFRRRMN